MRGQIGSWDEGLAVTLEPDALEWLDSLKVDRRVLVTTDLARRSVIVLPDPTGHRVSTRGMRNAVLHGVMMDWRLIDGPPLPRFELMPISLDPTNGIALEIGLPLDHHLPWPKLRECERYDVYAVAAAELERRFMSAACYYASLGEYVEPKHWSWVMPPDHVREMLRGFWPEALRRAIDHSTSLRCSGSPRGR